MNREDIIRVAKEAGVLSGYDSELFQRFANLVAAYEREACAKVCENHHGLIADSLGGYDIADAIRARGEE